MISKERIQIAMNLGIPNRVPVISQLFCGHYFLNSGVDPIDIWLTSAGFAKAFVTLQEKYLWRDIN